MKRSVSTSTWLFLLLITAVMLSACERPVPDAPGEDPAPVTDPAPDTGEQQPGDVNEGDGYPAPENNGGDAAQPPADEGGEDGGDAAQPPADEGGEEGGDAAQPPAGEGGEDGGDAAQPPAGEGGEDGGDAAQPPADETPAQGESSYTVQAGDTLFDIAQAFNVSVQDIVTANNLPNENSLDVGQVLVIPAAGSAEQGGGSPAEEPAEEPSEQPQTGEQVRVVQPGDNLFRIALEFGLTVDELAAYNGITNPARIDVGQVIRIPPSN